MKSAQKILPSLLYKKNRINLSYKKHVDPNVLENNVKNITQHLSNKTDCLCYQCLLDKFQKNTPTYKLIHSSNKECLCYQCLLDRYQEKKEKDNLENLLEEISK
jgi:hypothetical protein